ncbi:MAG: S8 family peptidase, partial [Bacteroidia bacterium]
LCLQKCVERIELRSKGLHPLDDSSISKNNIAKIHSGAAPLPQAYTGNGVIIGVIDTGVDPGHPDFKDTAGKSRILYLWDQNSVAVPSSPQPYNYGVEWNNTQIDSGLCTFIDGTAVGHGTKVTGVAAGNGNSAAQYKGIAPEADIISVAIDFASMAPVVTDAMDYIFSKATALGKPCVINISLGDYYGSHDGLDLETQLINAMTSGIPGRAVVAAAGNSGDVPIHLGYTVTADTNFTWFTSNASQIYLQFYADTANLNNVAYTIGVSDTSFNYKNNIGFNTIDSCMNTLVTDTLSAGANRFGIIQTYGSLSSAGTYLLEVLITPDSLSYLWSFEAKGNGKLDCWSADLLFSNLPSPSLYPRMIYYKRSDTLQTVCTGMQTSDEVITVGNAVARNGFLDVTATYQNFPGVNDSIFPTSSLGPTRDGRVKPDIVSTGENIVTTGAANWLTWLTANFPFVVTDDSLHMIFGGSSASAPAVAGFVALYLEKNPTATNQMIRQDVINCSRQDNFTGPTPNNLWGNGKLDGFNAMLCSNPVSVGQISSGENTLQVFPNPAGNQLTVSGKGIDMIRIYDAQGRLILAQRSLQENTEIIKMDGLPEGLYIVSITTQKGNTQRFKIIRQN